MNLSKITTYYLRDLCIDFGEFFILDIVLQDIKNALIITVKRDIENPFFRVFYKGRYTGFESLERMLKVLIECKHIGHFRAYIIKQKYNKYKNKQMKLKEKK